MKPLPPEILNGAWEKPGRNPVAAGFAVVILCGSLYSIIGSIVVSAVTLVATVMDSSWVLRGNIFEMMAGFYKRFQVHILGSTGILQFALFLGLPLLLVSTWHTKRPFRYLRYSRPAVLDLVLAAVSAVAVVPIADLLNRWAYVVFPILRELGQGESSLLSTPTPGHWVLVIAVIAVTPAICEEALFRGYFLNTLLRRMSPVPAIAVSGILFALFHQSPLSLIALVFVGFYLGFLFQRTGTIYAGMLAHFFYNLTVIILSNKILPAWPWLMDANGDLSLPVIAVSGTLFALLMAAVWLKGRKKRPAGGMGVPASQEGSLGPVEAPEEGSLIDRE
jgi:membrane protease YdiL (CAAX protease family)